MLGKNSYTNGAVGAMNIKFFYMARNTVVLVTQAICHLGVTNLVQMEPRVKLKKTPTKKTPKP